MSEIAIAINPPAAKTAARFLYFIGDGDTGPVKIGITDNLKARLSQLQTGHHADLRLIHSIDGAGWQERVWHYAFSRTRIRGEWFARTPDLLAAIRATMSGDEWIATLQCPDTLRGTYGRHYGDPDHRWREVVADYEELVEDRIKTLGDE